MSLANYNTSIRKAKLCKGYFIGKGIAEDTLKKAEVILGMNFSFELKDYLRKYSFINFDGEEVYGILNEDFSGIPAGEIVISTLEERSMYNLPKNWLTIYNYGDGSRAYQDYSNLNKENEPSIIRAEYFTDEGYVRLETVAEDFGDFLLQLVNESLEEQN